MSGMKQKLSLRIPHALKIREYHEQFFTCKFNTLEKIEQFLKKQKLLKYTQDEVENQSNPLMTKEIEFVIRSSQKRNLWTQIISLENSMAHLKKNYYYLSAVSSRKWKRREPFPANFMKQVLH